MAHGWGGNLFELAVHHRFSAASPLHPDGMDDDSPPFDITINPVKSGLMAISTTCCLTGSQIS